MRRRYPRLGVLEMIVIGLAVVAAVYTGWVIQDVSSGQSDATADLAQGQPASPSASVEVAPPAAPRTPAPLAPFTDAATEADTILVVGDSTGVGSGAWVDLVAQDLAGSHRVTLHAWDEGTGRFGEDPTSYGEAGPRLDVWNLSYQGVEADYHDHFGDLPRPDVVLLNVGHDRGPRAVKRAVVVTTDALGERWGDVPTAFVLQNPSVGDERRQQERAVARLIDLAGEYGYPVIDVHAAFVRADEGVLLVTGDSRPSADGSRLWADVVARALGAPSD